MQAALGRECKAGLAPEDQRSQHHGNNGRTKAARSDQTQHPPVTKTPMSQECEGASRPETISKGPTATASGRWTLPSR